MSRKMLRISEVSESKQIGQAVGMHPLTPRTGAIRHYMISRILPVRLSMNDKGPYHSYYMGGGRFPDLPVTRTTPPPHYQ